MSRFWKFWILAVACLNLFDSASFAQELEKKSPKPTADQSQTGAPEPKPAASTPEVVSEKQLAVWIQELADPKFEVRQTASQKLIEAGKAGIGAVASAADSKDLELATRCLSVLVDSLAANDAETRKAAREALERLTKCENKSVAQRAQLALDTPIGPLPGAVIPGPKRGQLPPMMPGGAKRMAMQVRFNAIRVWRINENGKQVVVRDSNGKEINVSITETVNGIEKTTTVTGKDPEDLKKNNPEAFAYFERSRKPVLGDANKPVVPIQYSVQKEIKVNENGREILINETNGKEISVSITETVNGNKKVITATGKDQDELKKNSPDAFECYEKYAKSKGFQFQVAVNGVVGNNGAPGVQPARRVPRFVNPIKAGELFDEIEKLRLKIDESNNRLQKATEADQPNVADLKKISEEIRAATKRLAEIKSESEAP